MQQRMRRSGITIGLLALGLLAGGASTASVAQAAESIEPFIYAPPSWNQKLAPATRFVVLSDWSSAAVLDRETGLVWERSPPATTGYTWGGARVECANRTTGGRKGWRLPSVHELASLVDPANSGPTLPTGHPFTIPPTASYWSATTNAEFPTTAWYVYFNNGLVNFANKPVSTFRVWCVRGGMNADQY